MECDQINITNLEPNLPYAQMALCRKFYITDYYILAGEKPIAENVILIGEHVATVAQMQIYTRVYI